MQSLIRCSLVMFVCALSVLPAFAQKPAVKLTVVHQPEILSPGSPFVMTVTAAKPLLSLEARWADGRRIILSSDKKAKLWRGVGVVVPKSPGEHSLELTGKLKSGKAFSEPHTLQISEGEFPQELIILLPAPPTETQSSGADPDNQPAPPLPEGNQGKRLQAAFTRLTLGPLWSGNFAEPLDQVTIARKEKPNFGEKIALRNFRPHRGEDMKADAGTPVKAMNSGIVVLAEEMRCEGRMIVLDHGQGWLSVYLHLSQLKVEINQRVTKEQVIALSGASGTCCHGAHLHVGVRWQTIYINPADVLKLEWPVANTAPPKPKPTPPKEPTVTHVKPPVDKTPLPNTTLNLIANTQISAWKNQNNQPVKLYCDEKDAVNCVTFRDELKLEDGNSQSRIIEMRPVTRGSIAGAYTISTPIQRGDKLLVKIGFAYQESKEGQALWIVRFQPRPGGPIKELGQLEKSYSKSLMPWEIDLSPYAGQTGKLIIETRNLFSSNTTTSGLVWVNPRIER